MAWLGRLDSNQRMRESKSLALPLGDAPMWKEIGDRGNPDPLLCLGWEMGLEPTTPGTTIRCSNQLSYTHHISRNPIFTDFRSKRRAGTPEGTRTPGPLLRRQLLYPAELLARISWSR